MVLRSAGITLLFATSSCIPSIKSVFVDLSYPDAPTESAPRDVVRSVDATVTPLLIGGYERPHDVGMCLADLAEEPAILDAFGKFGNCMAKGGTSQSCAPNLPWF